MRSRITRLDFLLDRIANSIHDFGNHVDLSETLASRYLFTQIKTERDAAIAITKVEDYRSISPTIVVIRHSAGVLNNSDNKSRHCLILVEKLAALNVKPRLFSTH